MEKQNDGKEKTITIAVNGKPREIPEAKEISYAEVVELAYPGLSKESEQVFAITFTRGRREEPEGILSPGGSVYLEKGMSFSVDRTGQA